MVGEHKKSQKKSLKKEETFAKPRCTNAPMFSNAEEIVDKKAETWRQLVNPAKVYP